MRVVLAMATCFLAVTTMVRAQDAIPGPIKIGQPAPDFAVTGIDGKSIKLSELTAKGKNVVLLFDRAHW